MSRRNRDYYFDMAINAVVEYVKKKDGIEWTGQDKPRYLNILKNDKKFHVFACFRYGLIIDYDSNTDELEINEVKDSTGRRYTKDELVFLKSSVDRFGSLKEFKAYREFKFQHTNIKNIEELNKEFRKEFGIPAIMPIPADLNNLIDSA
ncbi:MAG TPA: hypothetical protein VLA74_01570 [Nitrososphaeraceae archaeon]|nr:hypothetical protein [Nitrososphaeraceae archaeon]